MKEQKKNLEQNLKSITYTRLCNTKITLYNFHSIRNNIDRYLDTYDDINGFSYLINKIEEDYMKLFYPLNYN